ncbi:MAG: hypothetical protein D6819_04540 [Gammaproteobacteria bacterium]|nr:MAG: hypothetical protein D6819_04540 [Gammaproteobacteria bacterium]
MKRLLLAVFLSVVSGFVQAEERLRPFVLAWQGQDTVEARTEWAKKALAEKGFALAGEYTPYEGAHVIVVTNDALKKLAAQSERGGFGAMQRIGITQVGEEVQVAYTNPPYMAHAYRMAGDMKDIAQALEAALGRIKDFGSKEGMTPEELRRYHYMFGMPYFDDQDELASYGSYEAGLQRAEAGLAAGKGGVHKVYRIDLPGKQETVFGVQLTEGCSADKYIMERIDFTPLKHTPHLPYEFLVSGNKAYALNAKFRIAINFPDLGMFGEHSFASIMCAPDAIQEALSKAAGG